MVRPLRIEAPDEVCQVTNRGLERRKLVAGGALRLVALLLAAGMWTAGVRAAEQKPLWLAVARPELAAALGPLAEKRRSDGFDAVVATQAVEKALAQSARPPDFLLLVGDDEQGKEGAPWHLPAKRMPLYRWREVQPQEFASDAAWGDVNGDGVPDLPVGRIPARTRAEVELVVRKTLTFEAQPPTSADLQATAWLGSPEYSAAIDAVASRLGVGMFQAQGPPWLSPWFVSGNPTDPFCGWPPDQAASFTRQMKQGGLLSVLMGHASAEAFHSMKFGGKWVRYTADDAARELTAGPPVAPIVFISCHSGSFARPTPCQAERLLFLPGGPVAAIGATTESHPLPNYFTSVCLLKALGGKEKRLGALWLRAQREAKASRDFLMEMILRDAEGKLEKQINVEKLRRDQMLIYALLGDPATLLRLPEPLQASVERTAAGWRWQARRPPGATPLEVGYREPQPLTAPAAGTPTSEKEAQEALKAANARLGFATQPPPPGDGPWEGAWERPGWLRLVATGPGTLHVAVLRLN